MNQVLFTVPYGKAIRTVKKVYTEGRALVTTDVIFKGNPAQHAEALMKVHTPGGALGLIDRMDKVEPIDNYWKNVRGYVMRRINGKPAEKREKQVVQ